MLNLSVARARKSLNKGDRNSRQSCEWHHTLTGTWVMFAIGPLMQFKKKGALVAISVLSFPQSTISAIPTCRPKPARPSAIPAAASFLPPSTLRHRGLHLVGAGAAHSPASSTAPSRKRNTQAQADRIVAQVEQEIARQAFREHQLKLRGNTAAVPVVCSQLHTLPIAEVETPATVARRLFAALFSFARPA